MPALGGVVAKLDGALVMMLGLELMFGSAFCGEVLAIISSSPLSSGCSLPAGEWSISSLLSSSAAACLTALVERSGFAMKL